MLWTIAVVLVILWLLGGSDDAVPSISESQGDEKVFPYLFGIVNK